ncbi:hypothetical protein CYLTODRAFT_492802 [Cylindrobasidium torrendii FP15055 ss-10]|uniref:Uncharacterized protein n=1 Tax=Cylindrobasidium torrendii FP15055 ss-10 TaxID=1314674 RepID=A0A0D7B301_9AGAR|nr:hypothetical protein CYLTODRAFT_492802 [Cylindrobasidium torrendii FP15055 ss-10]
MAYNQQQQHAYPSQDVVSGEQYQYALTNFRIAHEKVEEQRKQLQQQEVLVAELRARIGVLEGGPKTQERGHGGNSVDDFSIRNAASQLDKLINRYASDIVRNPPVPLPAICKAIVRDVASAAEANGLEGTSMQTQHLLRHALSETISEGFINCLMVTSSPEANVQLTRIHEHLFARDPTVACVWRRQTFTAAVESCTQEMATLILHEQLPKLTSLFNGAIPTAGGTSILGTAYSFSQMLHGANNTFGDAFYRAFVPEVGSMLHPSQIELSRRCLQSERGDYDRVGATIFPGLVKVTRGAPLPDGSASGETTQTVVRRAQVICQCAMNSTATQTNSPSPSIHSGPRIASPGLSHHGGM